jgi:hypothetical protein
VIAGRGDHRRGQRAQPVERGGEFFIAPEGGDVAGDDDRVNLVGVDKVGRGIERGAVFGAEMQV